MKGCGTRKGRLGRCWVSLYRVRRLREDGVLKAAPRNVVLASQWFAPTNLVLSFETEGQGKFTPEEIDGLVERDRNGRVVSLNLPQKSVLIANHQVHECRPLLPQCTRRAHLCDVDLRRLVVRLVSELLYGNAKGCLHSAQEELEVGPGTWLGMSEYPMSFYGIRLLSI